ncbi:MAG: hypothetical protein V1708_02265 [Candidatus Micrarchaeota archaeon]
MPTGKRIKSGTELYGNFTYHSRVQPGDPLIPINPEGKAHAWHFIQSKDYSERTPAEIPKILIGFFKKEGSETWSCRIRSYPYDKVYVHRKTVDDIARLLGMIKINKGEWAVPPKDGERRASLAKTEAVRILQEAKYRKDSDDPDVFTHTGMRYKTIVLDESPTSRKMVENVRRWLEKNKNNRGRQA